MSGADTDSVSDTDLRQRHLCLLSGVRQKPDPVHMKRHVLRKIIYGFFMGPGIQRITESQQEAHRSGCGKITCQERSPDRNSVQDFNIQLPLRQRFYRQP